jgi:hypothetical protein
LGTTARLVAQHLPAEVKGLPAMCARNSFGAFGVVRLKRKQEIPVLPERL